MKRSYTWWTKRETDALTRGVERYGHGWAEILKDPEFAGIFYMRTNVNLKDRWYTMHPDDFPRAQVVEEVLHVAEEVPPVPQAVDDAVLPDLLDDPRVIKQALYHAVVGLADPTGSNLETITNFLKGMYILPTHFRKKALSNLAKLTDKKKLYKTGEGKFTVVEEAQAVAEQAQAVDAPVVEEAQAVAEEARAVVEETPPRPPVVEEAI